jgi:hypothetical protein
MTGKPIWLRRLVVVDEAYQPTDGSLDTAIAGTRNITRWRRNMPQRPMGRLGQTRHHILCQLPGMIVCDDDFESQGRRNNLPQAGAQRPLQQIQSIVTRNDNADLNRCVTRKSR